MVFNATGKRDDSRAGGKGQKRKVNVKDVKPDRKVDCWNCGGNYFDRKIAIEGLLEELQ